MPLAVTTRVARRSSLRADATITASASASTALSSTETTAAVRRTATVARQRLERGNQVQLRRGTGLGKLELCDDLSAEAPTAMLAVRSSVALLVQTMAWRNFNVHSARKDHALADVAVLRVLRPCVDEPLKARLVTDAADALVYSERHRNKDIPAYGVCLGRFDGSPVRGAGLYEHVVTTLAAAGLLKGMHAHMVGKAELKYVNWAAASKGGGDEPEPDGAGAVVESVGHIVHAARAARGGSPGWTSRGKGRGRSAARTPKHKGVPPLVQSRGNGRARGAAPKVTAERTTAREQLEVGGGSGSGSGGGRFYAAWADKLKAVGIDPQRSMTTPPHSDSGPQALNGAFLPGEVITVNTNPDDIKVHLRAVVGVAGDPLLMMVQTPTYGADGAHDGGWAIKSYPIGVGEIFVFEANAGVFLKHAAAVAPSGAASDGGCTTYAVFDIALADSPPNKATWAMPPPTVLAAPIADASWQPPDSADTSMEYWAKHREEQSAFSFLSEAQQLKVTEHKVAIHVARREARAGVNGQLPATAVAPTALLQALLQEGRKERGIVGEQESAASFLNEDKLEQLALAIAEGRKDDAMALIKEGRKAREEKSAASFLNDDKLEQLTLALAEGRKEDAMALIKEGRKAREEKSAAACLNGEDYDALERAHADGRTPDVERLYEKGRKARTDLAAAACLDAEDAAKLALARKEGRTADVKRLL